VLSCLLLATRHVCVCVSGANLRVYVGVCTRITLPQAAIAEADAAQFSHVNRFELDVISSLYAARPWPSTWCATCCTNADKRKSASLALGFICACALQLSCTTLAIRLRRLIA
jgi:hypothetical protein